MIKIFKENVVMAVRDHNQLAAFINNGWKKMEDSPKDNVPNGREEEKTYTKTDINRMGKDDLISLASNMGIADASELRGAELKKQLIERLEL